MRGSIIGAFAAAAWLGVVAIASEKPTEIHVKRMQAQNDAVVDLRKNVEIKDWSAVARNAASLKPLLKHTQTFWEQRKVADAVTLATSALKAVADIEASAKVNDEKGAIAGQRALNKACNSCHTAHREMTPDGKYAIK